LKLKCNAPKQQKGLLVEHIFKVVTPIHLVDFLHNSLIIGLTCPFLSLRKGLHYSQFKKTGSKLKANSFWESQDLHNMEIFSFLSVCLHIVIAFPTRILST
jgi:hypothetical protein